jgi:hypothetical protein
LTSTRGGQFAPEIGGQLQRILQSGQEFGIRIDDDANVALFIILVCAVIITRYNEPDGDSDLTIDLGNLLVKELQPFDETWRPKTS